MKIELSKVFLAVGLPSLILLFQVNDAHGVQATSFYSATSSKGYRQIPPVPRWVKIFLGFIFFMYTRTPPIATGVVETSKHDREGKVKREEREKQLYIINAPNT